MIREISMHERIMKILCCPECKSGLDLLESQYIGDEIKAGMLKCSRCNKSYPILDFIPRFVKSDSYAKNFSFEWDIHRRTQLDSVTGNSESKNTFIEKIGIDLSELKDKVILDVGCGMGRFIEVVQPYAKDVIGIDISLAVNSAYKNLRKYPNVHIIQANVFNLPFFNESFDFIYSIGVLHHTPSTKNAFMNLPRLLKKSGTIAIWVYSNELPYANIASDLYRHLTIHLPQKFLWYLSHIAVPLYHLKKRLGIRKVINLFFPTSDHPESEWRILDTFDWYSPRYQYKHTFKEVTVWFKEAGLKNIKCITVEVAVKGEKLG